MTPSVGKTAANTTPGLPPLRMMAAAWTNNQGKFKLNPRPPQGLPGEMQASSPYQIAIEAVTCRRRKKA
jgi:hypothetical protein